MHKLIVCILNSASAVHLNAQFILHFESNCSKIAQSDKSVAVNAQYTLPNHLKKNKKYNLKSISYLKTVYTLQKVLHLTKQLWINIPYFVFLVFFFFNNVCKQ